MYRRDFAGPTRGVRPTPQGGLCVEAAVARSGVLEYSDGTRTWREYRPEEEVFAADSLATLRGAVVTNEHPEALVTPDTFKAVSCGHAHDDVRRDGNLVVVDLDVQDAALCRLVEAGERRKVSCGYTCEVEHTAGVTPDGERYDAIQRRIRHNHVALLAPGEGRSGPEVSLRMDGAAVHVRRVDAAKGLSMKRTIKVRGVEYRLDADDKGLRWRAPITFRRRRLDPVAVPDVLEDDDHALAPTLPDLRPRTRTARAARAGAIRLNMKQQCYPDHDVPPKRVVPAQAGDLRVGRGALTPLVRAVPRRRAHPHELGDLTSRRSFAARSRARSTTSTRCAPPRWAA